MNYLKLFILLIFLVSCFRDSMQKNYEQIINDADSIKLFVKSNNNFKLKKEVVNSIYLKNIKLILTQNVVNEIQREFIPDSKIEIYSKGGLTGTIFIINSKDPFADFKNSNFGFGFKIPYRLGMFINETDTVAKNGF
ncbi:MAG TPA: hypothetical protein VK787_09340 [Puia sp.]|jgi:hypothetical protein|nr:hypothetical protein [Puia sp.]